MLTDRAKEGVERLVPWAILSALAFLAYAVSQHLGTRDGIAAVIAYWLFCRSLRHHRREDS